MVKNNINSVLFIVVALSLGVPHVTALSAASDLRVEYLRAPINVGIDKPRFSFVVNWEAGTARATAVAARRITVTEVLSGVTVWDSGMAVSNATSQIEYAGSRPLQPDTDYSWSVQWKSADGTTAPMANSTFSTALLSEEDWQGAEWIGSEEQRVLRATLKVTSASIFRARAYVAAPGCYSLYVNKRPAGDEMGVCPWTQFDRRVLYDAHDIAPLLTAGDNTIELVLGRGMYYSKSSAKNAAAIALFSAILDDGKHTRVILRSAGSPPPTPPPPAPTPRVACAVVPEHNVATLGCAAGDVIKNVSFGSFGTPMGTCSDPATQAGNTFRKDARCDAPDALAVLRELCVGMQSCMVKPGCKNGSCKLAAGSQMMPDPCHMTPKHLSAAIQCGSSDHSDVTLKDGPWFAAAGPIVHDDPFVGCTTDVAAANDPLAWSWVPAQQAPQPPAGDLHALSMPPAGKLRTLAPVAARVVGAGNLRFDFAENFVGVTEINATALAQLFSITGDGADAMNLTIVAKHGEITDGLNFTVPTAGTGNVSFPWDERKQTDVYVNVNVGAALPNLRPRFVWHGFQFVEVSIVGASATTTAAATAIASGAVMGINTGTDLETTGDVVFGGGITGRNDAEHMLNQIQRLVTNSQKANVAAGMPTDCPTREKHGWLGDAQVTAEEAMLNFNMAPVYSEFLRTIRDSQQGNSSKRSGDVAGVVPVSQAPPRFAKMPEMLGAGPDGITDISWSAAYPLITRWMLLHYGDKRVVMEHFDALDAFMNDLTIHGANTSEGGLPDFYTWGDWCAVEDRKVASRGTGPALAAFNYLLAVDAMAHMANVIGRESDGARYASLAAKLRPVFRNRFFNSSTGAYGQRELELQSLTAAPLALGGVVQPGAEYDGVIAALKKDVDVTQAGHLTVGSAGAKHLLVQLSEHGLHKEAMRVATQRDFPSFGFWLANGATTCWENYRGYADPSHPPPPTRNHIFLCGGVGEWMYRQVAGVAVVADGYERVAVAPHITDGGPSDTGPATARATLRTVRGIVTVSWARAPENGVQLALNVTVPPAVAGAAVTVPSLSTAVNSLMVYESGDVIWKDGSFVKGVAGVTAATSTVGEITFEVASGAYQFTTAHGPH